MLKALAFVHLLEIFLDFKRYIFQKKRLEQESSIWEITMFYLGYK